LRGPEDPEFVAVLAAVRLVAALRVRIVELGFDKILNASVTK
jgi:hypothetical protein